MDNLLVAKAGRHFLEEFMQLDLASGEAKMIQGVVEGRFVNLHGQQAVSWRLWPGSMGGELLASRQAIAGDQPVLGRFEVNGGRVWAESAPGEGACFVVELPLGPAAQPSERIPEEAR